MGISNFTVVNGTIIKIAWINKDATLSTNKWCILMWFYFVATNLDMNLFWNISSWIGSKISSEKKIITKNNLYRDIKHNLIYFFILSDSKRKIESKPEFQPRASISLAWRFSIELSWFNC